ncbi:MAG: hypothetical protein IT347_03005 [Candidatus Eisenbacteria bacterium]|nr:hypothetical protein [Candidatus Eisenbacteria bacterium]
MDDRRRPLMQLVAVLLLTAQLANAAPALAAPAPAAAGSSAASASSLVIRAQGFYREARYDEAIGLLAGPVLRKELSGQTLIDARLVLARCYVKKGILPRAKTHFEAILALDPAFTLDRTRADADEIAVFNEVKGVVAPPAATRPQTPVKPASPGKEPPAKAPATEPATPQLHKPVTEAPAGQKESWLKRNKYLAIGLIVGGGVAIGVAAGGGGGGGSTPPGPQALPGFPGVPARP